MAGSLRSRLARIREASAAPEVSSSPARASRGGATAGRPPAGAERGSGRRAEPPGSWKGEGDGLWSRRLEVPGVAPPPREALRLGLFSPRLAGREASAYGSVFFDLETTGLSGGAGTVAFLAALGRYREGGGFEATQYFMDDFPAEPALLERLGADLGAAEAVFTYNGASFDLPLYATRRAMNGLAPAAPSAHADAVHAARLLYRGRLPDCSLRSLEAEVLGLVREGDIPGAEVPEAWFDYLRRGRSERLGLVFSHNALDVASLAGLVSSIYAVAALGSEGLGGADPVGLAELQARLDPAAAEATLRGQLGLDDGRAARRLARLYGRVGRSSERLGLAPYLPDDAAGLYAKSIHAEKALGDREAALGYALRAAAAYREGVRLRPGNATRLAMAERAERKAERLAARLAASRPR